MTSDPVLDTAQAAAYARRHEQTIRGAARRGELAHIRNGRRGRMYFRQSDIDQWLESMRVEAR